jgi:peptidoglycan/LPS O-acetylase OafA/YrhL
MGEEHASSPLDIMEKTPTARPFFVPGYIPQFDGLRGVAVLSVLVGHSGFLEALPHLKNLEYTRFGVDLFFVLSGFLITGILLDSKGSDHYFRNFYARRALRIWPLYYIILFLAFVVTPMLVPSTKPATGTWPAFVFYVQNLALVHRDTYPFGLGATWSLAVEEQFYCTWPFLVFLLRKRTLAVVSFSLAVISLSLRLFFHFQGVAPGFVHFFTFSRLDAISFGTLAAIWLRSSSCTLERWRTRAYQFFALGLTGVVLARILMHRNSTSIGYTFLAFTFTGLLGMSLVSDARSSPLGRTLSAAWLRYIGKISYGIYLLHYPIFLLWAKFIRTRDIFASNQVMGNLLGFVGQMLLAFLAASISWHLLEKPILRLKERFPSGSQIHWPATQGSKTQIRAAITESRPA